MAFCRASYRASGDRFLDVLWRPVARAREQAERTALNHLARRAARRARRQGAADVPRRPVWQRHRGSAAMSVWRECSTLD
jgi:hypothetical protein